MTAPPRLARALLRLEPPRRPATTSSTTTSPSSSNAAPPRSGGARAPPLLARRPQFLRSPASGVAWRATSPSTRHRSDDDGRASLRSAAGASLGPPAAGVLRRRGADARRRFRGALLRLRRRRPAAARAARRTCRMPSACSACMSIARTGAPAASSGSRRRTGPTRTCAAAVRGRSPRWPRIATSPRASAPARRRDRSSMIFADHHYFPLLGVAGAARPRLRRGRRPAAGGPPVVVLSDAYWRAAFGGDPTVLGRDASHRRADLHRDRRHAAPASPATVRSRSTPGRRSTPAPTR